MSARPKSAAPNSSVKKAPPVTTTTTTTTPLSGRSVTKVSRSVTKSDTDTPVKLPTSRISGDHKASPRSVNSKPSVDSARPASGYSKSGSDGGARRAADGAESATKTLADRRASKLSLPPEAQQKRAPKALDLQAQLTALQEDLKKARDELAAVEKEKAVVVDELKEARRSAGETNEKLVEAQAGQKRAEETSEIEKFRAIEIEQAGIDAADKKQDEWNKKMEDMKIQHASDVDALLSATQELLRLKEELADLSDANNQAVSKADASAKESRAYCDKVDLLTAEIVSLKTLLDSKIESAANDGDVVLGMKSEIESLKIELERSRASGEKLEADIKLLNSELGESKMAQAYSNNLVKEWKQQVEELEHRVEEASMKERLVCESLNSLTKKLEETESLFLESKQKEAALAENVAQGDAAIEELHVELEASQETEATSHKIIEEWTQKAKELEKQVEEANLTEKTALDSLSRVKMQLEETRGLLGEANKKIASLAQKIEENGAVAEQLNVQLEASRMAEAYANKLVAEWKQTVEELGHRVEEANRSEKATKESLNSVRQELEMTRGSLKEAEAQIEVLQEKVGLLEMSFERQRGDYRKAESRAATAEADAFEMAKMIESLKIQLETVQEEKLQALDNEKLTASNVQSLLGEKNKLINDLENSKDEEEKSKKAMESLAAALHEVSAEAREAKENFLARQAEHETYESQIDDLKCILKETNEKYKTMLDDARHEVDSLMITIEKSKKQFEESKAEWEESKSELMNSVKQSEDKKSALENEITRLTNQLKEIEEGGSTAESEKTRLIESLKVAESELTYMQSVLGEAKAESMKLKESLLENESELQAVSKENDELRTREATALEKVEELSKLIESAAAKRKSEEIDAHLENVNGFLLLPKSLTSPEAAMERQIGGEEELGNLTDDEAVLTGSRLFQNMNGDLKKDEKQDEAIEIDENSYSLEKTVDEALDEDVVDIGSISFDKRNGSISHVENNSTSPPSRQQQKKKKAMLGRFGSLLKKNSSKSQKA
ncbi:unnamed protein product [Rhodiola kirilowii]